MDSDVNVKSKIIFDPPTAIQRYSAVIDVIQNESWQGKIQKVVEFGCASMGFFRVLKRVPEVTEIVLVDIDRDILESKRYDIFQTSDAVFRRANPLAVHVMEGSITDPDPCLQNTDAVVAIELIEHLYPDVLEEVPYAVFGRIQPKLVIMTTPNSEFNILFPDFSGMRHPDHKFEWTREQFQNWCVNIVQRFPIYTVSFEGVAQGPPGSDHLGCCSQMAVFSRKVSTEDISASNNNVDKTDCTDDIWPSNYNLITTVNFLQSIDERSQQEKIRDEFTYLSNQMLLPTSKFMSEEDSIAEEDDVEQHNIKIPLIQLMDNPSLQQLCSSVKELMSVLELYGWEVVDKDNEPAVVMDHSENSWSDSYSCRSNCSDEQVDLENQVHSLYESEMKEEDWSNESASPDSDVLQRVLDDFGSVDHSHSSSWFSNDDYLTQFDSFDVVLPGGANPFPEWLLNMLVLASGAGGDDRLANRASSLDVEQSDAETMTSFGDTSNSAGADIIASVETGISNDSFHLGSDDVQENESNQLEIGALNINNNNIEVGVIEDIINAVSSQMDVGASGEPNNF